MGIKGWPSEWMQRAVAPTPDWECVKRNIIK